MIVSISLSRGIRFGLITVAGTTLGVAAQLGFLIFGLSALIGAVAAILEWLRWAGLVYLLYLGMCVWNVQHRIFLRLTSIGVLGTSCSGAALALRS